MIHKKNQLIISRLRNNARESLTDMSRKTKIPISTIYENLKLLESSLVKRHTSLLDFDKLGYSARANLMLKVEKEEREILKEFLTKHQNVNSVFRINTDFDFLAELVFANINELNDFIEKIEERFKIKNRQLHYIIDDIKRESFMTEDILLGN